MNFVFLTFSCLKNLLKVPANIPPDSGKSSGNEESDVDTNSADGGHSRRVRFKQLVIKYQNQKALIELLIVVQDHHNNICYLDPDICGWILYVGVNKCSLDL
jgi:hypothetical protein